MPAYSVFEPPLSSRRGVASTGATRTDRFIFLREKFSFVAFLFGPLWMLARRLWVVLIIYVVAVGFLEFGLRRIGVGVQARVVVYVLIQFLVGIEATGLRRWTLARRGWQDCGIVIADGRELAERRFFDARSRPPRAARAAEPGPSGMTGFVSEPGGSV